MPVVDKILVGCLGSIQQNISYRLTTHIATTFKQPGKGVVKSMMETNRPLIDNEVNHSMTLNMTLRGGLKGEGRKLLEFDVLLDLGLIKPFSLNTS